MQREFQGELFPCQLAGADWVTAVRGTGVNYTEPLDENKPDSFTPGRDVG